MVTNMAINMDNLYILFQFISIDYFFTIAVLL